MTRLTITARGDSSYDNSYDSSGGDSSGSDQITYPTEDSGDSSGSDTSDIRIIQKIPPMIPDKITMRTGIILIMEMVLVPITEETIRRIPPIRILNTMNKKESCPAGLGNPTEFPAT